MNGTCAQLPKQVQVVVLQLDVIDKIFKIHSSVGRASRQPAHYLFNCNRFMVLKCQFTVGRGYWISDAE